MGCDYCNFDGTCQMFDEDIDDELCCDEDGNCTCEDDEQPDISCSHYSPNDDIEFSPTDGEDDYDPDDIY